MSPEDRYIIEHSSPEAEGLEWIRRQTFLHTNHARMMSGQVQGRLITMLTASLGVGRALEIGTFTGFTSACIALGLKKAAETAGHTGTVHLDTLEINDELESMIHEGWRRTGVDELITLHIGDARETLATMHGPYDMAYIDANKREYRAYFEGVLPLVRKGGIILADNTLWDGKVLEDPMPHDAQTTEIALFNEEVARDPRVETVIIPLRDGLTMMRKL